VKATVHESETSRNRLLGNDSCLVRRLNVGIAWLLALVAGLCATTAQGAPMRLYAATDGNDHWSGTLAQANAEKTDGPLASLEKARDKIREIKKAAGLPDGGVTVSLRGGDYQRRETFKLTAEDSGNEQSPIVYRSKEGETARLIGGQLLTGFKPVTDQAVLKRLEPAARGKVLRTDLKAQGISDFGSVGGGGLELFFGGKRMTVARWPNEEFVRIAGVLDIKPVNVRGTIGDRVGKFIYSDERPKRWAGEKDAWVHGYWFWDWADQRHKIKSIDTERRIIEVVPPYHGYGYRKNQWYYAFNLLAEIDTPGEWYLDRETGTLYFWPPGPVEQGRPTVSLLKDMIEMRETSHVSIQGITFDVMRGHCAQLLNCHHATIAGCTISNVGDSAIRVAGGTDNAVLSCDIYQVAAGGISLSGGDRKALTPAGHRAENNHIHHYGQVRRMYTPAVSLNGVGLRAAHNYIHDAPHMAIQFSGNDHLIELNHIHQVCLESNDAGAMYAGRDWTMRGTIVRHNFLHDILGFRNHGCVGVYLDDMFSGTTITGNVFHNVYRAAFIGGGRDCMIENNIFVDCPRALHIDARAMGWAAGCERTTMRTRLAAMPYKEPLWAGRYPRLVTTLDQKPAAPEGNLVTRNVFVGRKWDDINSTARPFITVKDNLTDIDPRFVDAPKLNFQLKPDSPVYQKLPGFKKIPFERIGLVKDPYRASLPAR